MNHHGLSLLLAIFMLAGLLVRSVPAQERAPGPWDMDALRRPPKVETGATSGVAQAIYYAGEPYAGHPTRIFAWLARPRNLSGKAPAMVLVHGGGGTAFRSWAEMWAARGYVALAMDLSGRDSDGHPLSDGGPADNDETKIPRIAQGVKESWVYHAVANVIRGVSLLNAMDEVDSQRIGITGISWGGYLTCIVAGLDDRLKLAIPVYGCGYITEDSFWLPAFGALAPADRTAWFANYEPAPYLARARMPLLFITGTNDFAYPLDSLRKSYRRAPGPHTLSLRVNMPHSHEDGWAPVEAGLFADSVLRGGTPLARLGGVKREGREVTASADGPSPLKAAELHYTTDTGAWKDRKWISLPARLEPGVVRATLPTDKGIVYYLTVTDDRGALVASDLEEL